MKIIRGLSAVALIVVAGCSNSGAQPSGTASGLQTKPAVTVGTVVSSTASTVTPGSTGGIISTSAPATPVVPSVQPSDGGATSVVDGANLKTFAGTQREYIDAFAGCMRAKGVPVDIAADGTMTYPGLPADQNTTLEQVQQQCVSEVGIIQTKNFTDEQLQAYYDMQHAQWKCLSDNGFSVAPAQTFQTYRDMAKQTGAPNWNVFEGVPETEVGAGLSKCPNKVAG